MNLVTTGVRTSVAACMGAALSFLSGCSSLSDPFSDPDYVDPDNPENGNWTESHTPNSLDYRVGELHLSNGKFKVTYTPLESYYDYWGSYKWDKDSGHVTLEVHDGNRIPRSFVSSGRMNLIEERRLRLKGINLDERRPQKLEWEFHRGTDN